MGDALISRQTTVSLAEVVNELVRGYVANHVSDHVYFPTARKCGKRTQEAVQTSDKAHDATVYRHGLVWFDQLYELGAVLRRIGES